MLHYFEDERAKVCRWLLESVKGILPTLGIPKLTKPLEGELAVSS